jgi:predicted RND superfamily exporter protein
LNVELSGKGHTHRRQAIQLAEKIVSETPGLSDTKVYMGGTAVLPVLIDRETNRSLSYVLPCCLIGFCLTWIFVRNLRLTLIVLFAGAISALFSLAFVNVTGHRVNGLLVLMPALVLVLTFSGGIHLVSYFQDELRHSDWQQAIVTARRNALKPCTYSILTTCVAVLSLGTSRIQAVQQFGFFTAISLIFALFAVLILIPSWIKIVHINRAKLIGKPNWLNERTIAVGLWFNSLLVSKRRIALVACCLIGIFLSFGLLRTRSVLDPEKMFPQKHKVIVSYDWFRQNLFGFDVIEMMVQFDGDQIKPVEQLQTVEAIQRKFKSIQKVNSTFSAVNFYGPIPDGYKFGQIVQRNKINEKLNENAEKLNRQRLWTNPPGQSVWRLRLGLNRLDDKEYGTLTSELTKLDLNSIEGHEHVDSIVATGVRPMIAQSRQRMFGELTRSFMLAFAVITPIMMILLRNFWAGILAMTPNIAPTIFVFGSMGWLDWPITIGTILTASVGLGIAVDDTLHFVHWFSKYSRQIPDRMEAIRMTIRKCIRPMVQTSLICGVSMLAFLPANFLPVRQFAITIAILLVVAVICDLVLLPLILASRLGKFFVRQKLTAAPPLSEKVA